MFHFDMSSVPCSWLVCIGHYYCPVVVYYVIGVWLLWAAVKYLIVVLVGSSSNKNIHLRQRAAFPASDISVNSASVELSVQWLVEI